MSEKLNDKQKQYIEAEKWEQLTCAELTAMVVKLDERLRKLEESNE